MVRFRDHNNQILELNRIAQRKNESLLLYYDAMVVKLTNWLESPSSPPASVGDDDTTNSNSNNNHDDGVGDGTESCHSDDSTNTVAHFIDAGMDAGLISPRTAVFDALIAFRSQSVLMQAQMETVERQNVELQFKRHLVVAMRTKMSLFSSSSS